MLLEEEEYAPAPIEDRAVLPTGVALNMSECHLCGYRLEWEAKVTYLPDEDRQVLSISARCCGKTFRLVPELVTTVIEE